MSSNNLNWSDLIKLAHGFDIEAAASEAKKNALAKKYDMPLEDVNACSEIDPTPNGEYTEWLCKELKRDELGFDRIPAHDITTHLVIFSRLKNSPEFRNACAKHIYSMDINKYDLSEFLVKMKEAESLVSKNQRIKNVLTKSLLWSGEFEGHKIEVFKFESNEEAYALISGGPSLSRHFNPSPQTSWCTTQEDTARDYLEEGDAYIIRVDGKNYCNLHEGSSQCMDSANRSFATNRVIKDPIVEFAIEEAKIHLEYFKTSNGNVPECSECHEALGGKVYLDTREAYGEEKFLCQRCFETLWVKDIQAFIRDLPSEYFVEPKTYENEYKWIQALWELDGKEPGGRNFWNPEDVKQALEQMGVYSEAIYTGPITTE
jgi:hypothetical protein